MVRSVEDVADEAFAAMMSCYGSNQVVATRGQFLDFVYARVLNHYCLRTYIESKFDVEFKQGKILRVTGAGDGVDVEGAKYVIRDPDTL